VIQPAYPNAAPDRGRRDWVFGIERGMAMQTLIVSCLVAAAWAAPAVSVRAGGDSAPMTVVLRVNPAMKYAEVVKIVNALGEAHVSGIQLETAGPHAPGASAVIRARSDTPHQAVLRALEALHRAGVRKTTLTPAR
jgi:biopolymer transport protein ExbD